MSKVWEEGSNMTVNRLLLEKIRFSYGTEILGDVIRNLTVEERVDFETRVVRILFNTFVPGRVVRKEVKESVAVYKSWWEQFKANHFPPFIKRRYPIKVKYEPVITNHYHLCPHTGLGFHGHNDFEHISFLQGEEDCSGVICATSVSAEVERR